MTLRSFLMRSACIFASVAVLLAASSAWAGGLYFTDRGVRPLGRGGAFVAGADDLGAISYNPAGLIDARSSVLFDVSFLRFDSTFERETLLRDPSGATSTVRFPAVSGRAPLLPIPTLAGAYAFGGRKEWVVAAGVYAPNAPLSTYPGSVNGEPAPQRYTLVSLAETLLVVPTVQLAFAPFDALRIGLGVQALTGEFRSRIVMSASPPGGLIAAPEDPSFDALTQVRTGPIFAPSATAGVIAVLHPLVRVGLAGQLPFSVDAPSNVRIRLPSSSLFDSAQQEGERAQMRFGLPGVFRAGIELHPIESLRTEVAYVHEWWSAHDSIQLDPKDVKLVGITGFPSPYAVGAVRLPRNFRNTSSFRIGAEYRLPLGEHALTLRTGGYYEPSAIPPSHLSVLTIDLDKVVGSLGASFGLGSHWRFDATYAHVFSRSVTVPADVAQVPLINPVQGNPTDTYAVNGGRYAVDSNVFGLGVMYTF